MAEPLFTAGALVDKTFYRFSDDKKHRLAQRTAEQRNMVDALEREHQYASVQLGLAQRELTAARATAERFEKSKEIAKAVAARLEEARRLERVEQLQGRIRMILAERDRWSKKKPDRDTDWP